MKREGLVLVKSQLRSKEEAIIVFPRLKIHVPVSLLGEDELAAHFLDDIHEGFEKVALLLLLVLVVQLVEDLHLLDDALVDAIQIVLIEHWCLCSSFRAH